MSDAHGEYHDGMVAMLELIWGEGFMAPGGPALVRETLQGLKLDNARVLDIGSGLGGGDLVLAELGANVVGIDIEPGLIRRAERLIARKGRASQVQFELVAPGPLPFPDGAFDLVYSSGAFTQIADKRAIFAEVKRVLRPGGWLAAYDWMKGDAAFGEEMAYFFKLEGLTYAMETPEAHRRVLEELGFGEIRIATDEGWYRRKSREEYEQMKGPLHPCMIELLGAEQAAHFVENWRAMTVVLDRGDLNPGRYRARKPHA
ncbi:MAG: class I SAM-dependent methyltransferase [Dongiaceae bacterium]